jgi:DNA-binding GntR family transcriptional regulator
VPGDRLVERELAEELGVSRVPVREAILTLTNEGFVVAESPRRIVVRQLSRQDVEEIFDVREALEVKACSLAAERATDQEKLHLAQLLELSRQATHARSPEIARLNDQFHEYIVALAHNSLLSSILDSLQGRLSWLTQYNKDWDHLLSEHAQLCDAIAAGQAWKASELALNHIRGSRETLLASLFH